MIYPQDDCSTFGSSKSNSSHMMIPVTSPVLSHDLDMSEAPPLHRPDIMPHYPQRFMLGHGGVSGSHSIGVKTPTRCIKKRNHGTSSLGRGSPALQASKVAFYVSPPRYQKQRQRQRHSFQSHSVSQNHSSIYDEPLSGTKRIDFLLELPYELSIHIISYLDTLSLVQLSSVSRGIHDLSCNNDIWRRRVMEQHWQPSPSQLLPTMDLDWFHIYKQRYQLANRWTNGKVNTHYLVGHRDSVYCLQFDKQKIITGSRDRTIKIWNMDTYRCIRTLPGHRASVLCLQFNDKIMVSGSSDTTLIMWDMETLQPIKSLKGHSAGVLDLSLDDRYIVSCSKDSTIKIWDVNTGDLLRTISGHQGPVNAVQLHGNIIVSASGDTLVKMWDVKTGECIRQLAGHTRGLACVQFDGKRIITGSADRTIRAFDAETGECTMVYEGHTDLVRSLHFDEDRIISCSYDQSIRVYDIRSGACLLNFQSGHASWVLDVHFDKTKIVSASQDYTVLVMDFAQGLDTQYF
ncbi:WD40-repeat-containing domain protein [Absidia repens]|uniref:WD40-repeat-containing domain protein n=1 Tax=Absidia repens TaxID=90262 RepID=A0A1X2IZ03_9FUNG|nr:WD40-repeat-containing domain protein [Absidia repens]